MKQDPIARTLRDMTTQNTTPQPLTQETMHNLIAAIVRMEHKTTGSMNHDEYIAAASLCVAAQAPQFFVDYFAKKAQESQA